MPDEEAPFSPPSPSPASAHDASEATPSEQAHARWPSLSLSDDEGESHAVFLDVPGDVWEQISPHAFEASEARAKSVRAETLQKRLRPLVSGYVEPGQPFVDRHTLRRLLAHEQEGEDLDLGSGLTLTRRQVAAGILAFGALLLLLVIYGILAG